jgi:ABC-type multidrug transport system fused ATPase/permease subunit
MEKNEANEGPLMRSFNFTRRVLSPVQKRRALAMVVLSIVSSFVEVFGLATLVPIVVVCTEPGGITKNKYINAIYKGLGFTSEKYFLILLLVSVVLFFILKTLFTSWVNYVQGKFTSTTVYDVIQQQLNKYMGLKFLKFNDLGSGKLINSSLNVPGGYLVTILRPMIAMATEIVVALTIIGGLLFYNPALVLILAVTLAPPMAITYRLIRSKVQNIQSRINVLWPISIGYVSDLSAGFIELRLARKQKRFITGVLKAQHEIYELDAVNYVYSLLPQKVIELAAIGGVVVILAYSIITKGASSGTVALVGLFAAAAYRLMPSLNRILTSLVTIRGHQHVITDVESFRDKESQEEVHAVQQPLSFDKNLEFKNLSFHFPGETQLALNDISFTIRKGEKVGFIGSSGSGKTTLMNVVLRFLVEQQGQILVDGSPLGPHNIDGWHQIIGYVKQDTFLMQASIQDNITLGETNPDKERLAYALEQASLKSFVDSLANGLDTLIGERGSKLSGGQRQRIGIARALYKKTQILILDEATSALDNETEREVNEAINQLTHTDITILIVAHRLTTLRECDRVYELNNGKLIAEHQYEALLSRIH